MLKFVFKFFFFFILCDYSSVLFFFKYILKHVFIPYIIIFLNFKVTTNDIYFYIKLPVLTFTNLKSTFKSLGRETDKYI